MQKRKKQNTIKKTDWEPVSDWYMKYLQEDTDSYHAKVIIPNLLRLLGKVEGKKILDLGCGNGVVGHILSEQKALVYGVDGSKSLIDAAKSHVQKNEQYFIQDVRLGLPKECCDMDICVSVMSIQNMDALHKVFDHVSKALKKDGVFHIVTLHPSFRIPQLSDWTFDEKRKEQGRTIFTYMSETKISIAQNPSKKDSPQSITFHRPLQVYSKTLQNSGFMIRRIEEWCSHKESLAGKRKSAEDKARKEIPMFLYIEAVRVQ
ncbi:MAG: class I SAM-dependent methyltransferase [Minisyncoccia bacterium]